MVARALLLTVSLPLLMVPGCSGRDEQQDAAMPPRDSAGDVERDLRETGLPDVAPDQTVDLGHDASSDSPTGCAAKTAAGMHLNPGCDPDVQATGLDAADLVVQKGVARWHVTNGTKYWVYDHRAASGSGAFVEAGQLAPYLKTFNPVVCNAGTECFTWQDPGTGKNVQYYMNPGCNNDVHDAMASFAIYNNAMWAVTSGTKFWVWDSEVGITAGAFTMCGDSLDQWVLTFAPDCTAKSADGVHLNPGCDPEIQSDGPTSIDISFFGKTAVVWLITLKKKWWRFDVFANLGKGAFVESGQDFSTYLKARQPDCSAQTKDGLHLNPGCDPDVQTIGVSTISGLVLGQLPRMLITRGLKWWIRDRSSPAGAFVDGGKDLPAFLRSLGP